jgi:hypothetical protein
VFFPREQGKQFPFYAATNEVVQREDEQPQPAGQPSICTSIEFLTCPTVLFHIVDRK